MSKSSRRKKKASAQDQANLKRFVLIAFGCTFALLALLYLIYICVLINTEITILKYIFFSTWIINDSYMNTSLFKATKLYRNLIECVTIVKQVQKLMSRKNIGTT